MEFKLVLVPKTPEEVLLVPETPLSGLKFMEVAGQCLRRSIDLQERFKHVTLGCIHQYEVTVPQSVAIASGWFEKTNRRYLQCEQDLLSSYVFYGASMARIGTTAQIYPYYTSEIVIVSYIDELAFINTWAQRGYPEYMSKYLDNGPNIPLVPDAEDEDCPNVGDLVLDDLLQGVG